MCLFCGEKTYVVNTRTIADGRIVRQRTCCKCFKYFYTVEEPVDYAEIADDLSILYKKLRNMKGKKRKGTK